MSRPTPLAPTRELAQALALLEARAVAETDGHFTVFRFTSEWKAMLGTPEDVSLLGGELGNLPGFATLGEALTWAADAGRNPGAPDIIDVPVSIDGETQQVATESALFAEIYEEALYDLAESIDEGSTVLGRTAHEQASAIRDYARADENGATPRLPLTE